MQRQLHAKISRNKYPQRPRTGAVGTESDRKEPCARRATVYFRRAAAATPRRVENVKRSGVGRPCGLRSEEHTSELQSHLNLVCRLLLEKKKKIIVNKKAIAQ